MGELVDDRPTSCGPRPPRPHRRNSRLAWALGAVLTPWACGGSTTPALDGGAGDAPIFDGGECPQDGPDDSAQPGDAPTPPPSHGLRGEYFDDYIGPPALARVDPAIDFNWGEAAPGPGVPQDLFSVRWTGQIEPRHTETYTFETLSDDGVRLWIDGRMVVDNWTIHPAATNTGTAALTAGRRHDILLEIFEHTLIARIHLYWSSPSQAREIIPSRQLYPTPPQPPDAGSLPAPRPLYRNPVIPNDCPDPGVLRADGGRRLYYMACTGGRMPIRRSTDLVIWHSTDGAILPSGKAPWANNGNRNWAPEIHRVGSRYVAYYTASDQTDRLAIGAASSDSPTGPYTDLGTPLVRDANLGAIDATFFRDDDGRQYLYWKLDGNAVGQPTPIRGRELRPDGLGFAPGSTVANVLTNDPTTWEGGVVEAPWVVRRGAFYYLFYSGNVYDDRYRTGVARASAPLASFTKLGAPILRNNPAFVGPGHGSVVSSHGEDIFVYHAWRTTSSGARDAAAGRHVLVDRILWDAGGGGWPRIGDGTPGRVLTPWP